MSNLASNAFAFVLLIIPLDSHLSSCSFSTYPKTKTKKGKIGMSAANANLRNYVLNNLEVDDKKIWYIPYKKNIFKKKKKKNPPMGKTGGFI